MTRRNWFVHLRPRPGERMPTSLRLVIAAVSGAALSLSYVGFYLSIYSWICIGILLISIFGARPAVAFACGFLHGLLFCLTSVPWIATVLAVHGGVFFPGRVGCAAADCIGVGNFNRDVCVDRAPARDAQHRTGLYWGALRVGDFRICARAFAGDKFPLEFAGLSGGVESGTHSTDEYHGNLWAIVFGGGIQCLAGVG